MHIRHGWAVAVSIVLATSRSGGWQAGGDGSSLHQTEIETGSISKPPLLFGAGAGSATGVCVGIPAPKVRKCFNLQKVYPGLDAPTKGGQKES